MQKTVLRTIWLVFAFALLGVGSAYALKVELDGTVVSATATIMPRDLPAKGGAPVTIESVTRIKTTTGAAPAALSQIVFIFDRHGFVDTKGLATCSESKLVDATPQEARGRCAKAIVGEGTGQALVTLPGAPPTQISSPLTFFNAPPAGGKPTLLIHAYETLPAPKAVVLPVAIERIDQGRYGFRVKIDIPAIAGGYGSPTLAKAKIGATWKRGGKTVGYTNAYCNGGRLQLYGTLRLADGSFFPGTLTSPCHESA